MPKEKGQRESFIKENGFKNEADVLETAIENMKSEDRNVRFAALRIISQFEGEKAANGVLTGLHDSKRRVRRLAVKSALNFCQHERIRARLSELMDDENEISKVKGAIFFALTGNDQNFPKVAVDSLKVFAQSTKYRWQVLWKLAGMKMTKEIEMILRDFVKNGTKEEAVLATRVLCGYKVVNLGSFDKEERKKIIDTCDIAYGRVYYWVKREENIQQ